jgi:hypothetical protein
MFLIDGAQLYVMKALACWIYIWVLLNLSPAQHYKKSHILIGVFIPGPNNPKNIDSFLFPGLQHLVALQRKGCCSCYATVVILLAAEIRCPLSP